MKATTSSFSLAIVAIARVGILPTQAAPGLVKNCAVGTGFSSGKATGVAATFKPSVRKLHCVLTLTAREVGNRYKGVWVAVDAGGLKNYKIGERIPPKLSADTMETSLELPSDWPVGKYRVDWFRDGKALKSAPFSIK